MKKSQRRVMILLLVLLAIGAALVLSLGQENITYYRTVNELLHKDDKFRGQKLRVMGLVEVGSVNWSARDLTLAFRITEDGKSYLPVHFQGVKPDLFKEGQGVVVEGIFTQSGLLQATNLLVKHSEEYRSSPQHSLDEEDKAKYIKTLENL